MATSDTYKIFLNLNMKFFEVCEQTDRLTDMLIVYGHIYFHPVVCSSFFFSFLTSSQRSEIGCLPYFHTWCGLSANLGCRSETCCTRLAGNAGRKKIAKKSLSAHHRTTLSGYIFATKARIDNWKKTC